MLASPALFTSAESFPSGPATGEKRDTEADAARYVTAARIMESLLHDVRNPLNALAINAEVLMEKLRDDTGFVPPGQEKNLKAIRDQIQRVDTVLRRFAQFIAPAEGPADIVLSDLCLRAVDVLGHESRRGRVRVVTELADDVKVHVNDLASAVFAVFRPLLRAIERTEAGGQVSMSLKVEQGRAVIRVTDGGGTDPSPELRETVQRLAADAGFEAAFDGSLYTVTGGIL